MIAYILMMAILIIASIYDIRYREIPLWTMILAMLISIMNLIFSIYLGKFTFIDFVYTAFPGILFLLLAFLFSGSMGFGDGAMLLAVSPVFGVSRVYLGIVIALLFNVLFSIILIILKKAGRKTKMPFIPFLTIGIGGAIIAFI